MSTQHQRAYLTVREVAEEYGNSVGFWRKAILERAVPFVKIGRSVRIGRDELQQWLAARRVPAKAEAA